MALNETHDSGHMDAHSDQQDGVINANAADNLGNANNADNADNVDAGSQPIRVLLADDQSLIRAGFAMVINSQPDLTVVGEASDGVEAVQMTHAVKPDVVLMDVRMPHRDGIAATADISRMGLATHVIILTTFDLDEYVMAAIRAGASGFLLKDMSPEEMLSSIRTVAAGNAIIAPSATKRLISRLVREPLPTKLAAELADSSQEGVRAESTQIGNSWAGSSAGAVAGSGAESVADSAVGAESPATENDDHDQHSHSARRILDSLTPREREVLVEVAHGLSNQEIAEKLFISLPTLKTHVAHILAKTHSRDRVQAVVFAYENNLVD